MCRLLILFGGVGGKQRPQLVWAALVGTHKMLACHCLPCPTRNIFFTSSWVYKLMCVSLGVGGRQWPPSNPNELTRHSLPFPWPCLWLGRPLQLVFRTSTFFFFFLNSLGLGEKTFVSRSGEQSKGDLSQPQEVRFYCLWPLCQSGTQLPSHQGRK